MCIAVYKPMGESFPSKSQFKTMFKNNSDGCGFMFADGQKVVIKKGFMSFNSFWKAFQPYKTMTERAFVFHFRIATHGGINRAMTQPFPYTDRISELKRLETRAPLGIAHNGIMPITYDAVKISDTALFIKKYLTRIVRTPHNIKQVDLDIIDACIDSKMILLQPNGNAYLIGKFIHDDGVYYSNKSYKPTEYKYTSTSKSAKSYSYDYESDYDDNSNGFEFWKYYGYNSYEEYINDMCYYDSDYFV